MNSSRLQISLVTAQFTSVLKDAYKDIEKLPKLVKPEQLFIVGFNGRQNAYERGRKDKDV